jgi:L-2,4-diaminobutyrate decarboxylase
MWMYVDGAYVASVALSKSHRSLMKGVGRADSLSWDVHKWLFLTYGYGIVIVREKRLLVESLASNAEYIQDAAEEATHNPNFLEHEHGTYKASSGDETVVHVAGSWS